MCTPLLLLHVLVGNARCSKPLILRVNMDLTGLTDFVPLEGFPFLLPEVMLGWAPDSEVLRLENRHPMLFKAQGFPAKYASSGIHEKRKSLWQTLASTQSKESLRNLRNISAVGTKIIADQEMFSEIKV